MSRRIFTIISFILATAGLVLAVLSWTDLCSFSGCTEAHEYRFFGISLQLVGTLYFCILIATMLISTRCDKIKLPLHLMLAGGAGAEAVMIHLQKNVIQAWCPLCLGIAASVFLLCLVKVIASTTAPKGDTVMNKKQFISKFMLLTVAAIAGFAVSFVGIKKPEAAGIDTALGKYSSKVEVYIFSDWLCPICVKVEPIIEEAYKSLEKKAKLHFIDKPVHKESMNFVPYHLSFLVNEKPKYIALRKALFELAKTNKNPSLTDVQAVISPLGVTYKQLSFMDVSQTMAQSQALSTEYKVTGTPTIVIVNSVSKKSKTLVGSKDITAENLLKAVKSLE
ncbi:MAG: thioredoxin domain-containing protein [Geobacteraceae bacterium]|nr:thioredoxin domain-containing protein [Geobacteraceae bacterium]